MEHDLYETLQDLVQDHGVAKTIETLVALLNDGVEDERDEAAIPGLNAALAAVLAA